MFDTAKKILDERVVRVSEYQKFKKELENGKMIDCSWCGNQTCEDKIKEETGADLRVIPSDTLKWKHVFTVKIQALQMCSLLVATE